MTDHTAIAVVRSAASDVALVLGALASLLIVYAVLLLGGLDGFED